jgi:hypothetical protein
MSHEHCDKCYRVDCSNLSSCSMLTCLHGCRARMHACKRTDHESICPNIFVPCLNAVSGCPLTLRRRDLSRHLFYCPASIVVCSHVHMHQYHSTTSANTDDIQSNCLSHMIARRDHMWYNHIRDDMDKRQRYHARISEQKARIQSTARVIRSDRYRYITMPACMLSTNDGVICSTCRKHLRQLEENEDQRLAEATDGNHRHMLNSILVHRCCHHCLEERTMMSMINVDTSTSQHLSALASLNSTTIDSIELPNVSNSSNIEHSNSSLSIVDNVIQSEQNFPSSYIYRLNYFASLNKLTENCTFSDNISFACLACCRRDEIEQHLLVHYWIDSMLNTSLIQRCPKARYGCLFQTKRFEPCQSNNQPIEIHFDRINDAIAFQWYPTETHECNASRQLLDLPTEVLIKILLRLDSLSLRNLSRVCHVCTQSILLRYLNMYIYFSSDYVHYVKICYHRVVLSSLNINVSRLHMILTVGLNNAK